MKGHSTNLKFKKRNKIEEGKTWEKKRKKMRQRRRRSCKKETKGGGRGELKRKEGGGGGGKHRKQRRRRRHWKEGIWKEKKTSMCAITLHRFVNVGNLFLVL